MIHDILGRFRWRAFLAWRGPSSPSIRNSFDHPAANPAFDHLRTALLVAASIACGWIAWSGEVLALPVAAILPAFWAVAPSRWAASGVSAGYFLAASRGMPQGVANFYAADLWPGLLLWLAASLSFVGVHAALWSKSAGKRTAGKMRWHAVRPLRYLAVLVLTGLPPFGITGWAHPLTAAGMLFPGWGWWGLFALTVGLLVMTTRIWPAAAIMLAAFWLWSAATWTGLDLSETWRGVDLAEGQNLGRDGSLKHHLDLIATVQRTITEDPSIDVVVMPESTLGLLTPTVEHIWRDGLRETKLMVIAGAAVIDADGYDNVLVAITPGGGRILYRERMPVPVSMWQPWLRLTGEGGGARAHLFGNPVVEAASVRIAPLICYEQLILWPALQSMIYAPDVIVASGNGWWTAGTSIVAIQKASVTAWARLFGLPVVIAFNT